jgi:hypothetical protein
LSKGDVLAKLADLAGMDGKSTVRRDVELTRKQLQEDILAGIKSQEDLKKSGMYDAVKMVLVEMDDKVEQARLQNIVTAIDGILLDRELTKQADELVDRMYEITSANPKKELDEYDLNLVIERHVDDLIINDESKKNFKSSYKDALSTALKIQKGERFAYDDYAKVLKGEANIEKVQERVIGFRGKLESLKKYGQELDAKELEWQKQNPRKAAIMKMVPKKVVSALKKAKSKSRSVKKGVRNVLNKNGLGRW